MLSHLQLDTQSFISDGSIRTISCTGIFNLQPESQQS